MLQHYLAVASLQNKEIAHGASECAKSLNYGEN